MKFNGFQKLTLLDYPGKTACTVFTPGCNLRCPFCHNSNLVLGSNELPTYDQEEIISYLKKRSGLIDGICITGGEPMLHKDLPMFCEALRELNVSIKIDTNGFFPSQLKYIVNSGLCDYIAMDVKNSLEKYKLTVGASGCDLSKVIESISFLKSSDVDHEFRTTVCHPLHEISDIISIAELLGPDQKYFLQSFVDSGALLGNGMSSFTPSEMKDAYEAVRQIMPMVAVRGVNF